STSQRRARWPQRALRPLRPIVVDTRTGDPMTIERVAVLGAGTMGSGIAAQLVVSGFTVELFDPDDAALERAVARVAKRAQSKSGAEPIGVHLAVADAVANADLVIEAAPA